MRVEFAMLNMLKDVVETTDEYCIPSHHASVSVGQLG